MILAILLASILVSIVVHILGMAAAGRLIGAKIETISLFFGPRLWHSKMGDTEFVLSLIPLGGFVKFDDGFQKFHPLKRVFVAASGCALLLVLAVVAFGFSGAFQKFFNGFMQILSGVLSPRSYGSQLFSTAYEFLKAAPFLACLGLIASKMAAANMLPLPTMNGGEIILTLLSWVKPMPERVRERIQQFGFLILLIILICWIVAFVYFLIGF
jgi:membrane-associated protease RseP (regulator of RpoE activity)